MLAEDFALPGLAVGTQRLLLPSHGCLTRHALERLHGEAHDTGGGRGCRFLQRSKSTRTNPHNGVTTCAGRVRGVRAAQGRTGKVRTPCGKSRVTHKYAPGVFPTQQALRVVHDGAKQTEQRLGQLVLQVVPAPCPYVRDQHNSTTMCVCRGEGGRSSASARTKRIEVQVQLPQIAPPPQFNPRTYELSMGMLFSST